MPRGRHRQAPPLHRLLAPSAVAAFALLCAGGSWLVADAPVLRGLAAGAAAAAVTGAVLLRTWDQEAGRRVAETRAAAATAELRADERQAETEADLEKSRALRAELEKQLRAKRAELTRLRTEHAALLRRYAHAETERASVLEGRRQLAIAAAEPVRALTTGAADHRSTSGAPTPLTYLQANEALNHLKRNAVRQRERTQGEGPEPVEAAAPAGPAPEAAEPVGGGDGGAEPPAAAEPPVPPEAAASGGLGRWSAWQVRQERPEFPGGPGRREPSATQPYARTDGRSGGPEASGNGSGFDFFGAPPPATGDEGADDAAAEPAPEAGSAGPVLPPSTPRQVAGKVIDLAE